MVLIRLAKIRDRGVSRGRCLCGHAFCRGCRPERRGSGIRSRVTVSEAACEGRSAMNPGRMKAGQQRLSNNGTSGRNAMKNTVVQVLFIVSFLSPVAAFAQAGKTAPTTATYIMKEDIDKVGATEQSQRTRDENVKVIDLGYENFAVGIVHRASTRTPP